VEQIYIRALPDQPDRWLKYNDTRVTDVSASEVLADTTGSTSNPYWLSFVRKGQRDAFETVKREIAVGS
jgi:ubiquitin carboxyl-terminal hydrolase 25